MPRLPPDHILCPACGNLVPSVQTENGGPSIRHLHAALSMSILAFLLVLSGPRDSEAQEARRRWERMCQIRNDKFDLILPEVMRENGIDMSITTVRKGDLRPLCEDMGRGYPGSLGFYVFTDRGGDRIERATLGVGGYLLEQCGVLRRPK